MVKAGQQCQGAGDQMSGAVGPQQRQRGAVRCGAQEEQAGDAGGEDQRAQYRQTGAKGGPDNQEQGLRGQDLLTPIVRIEIRMHLNTPPAATPCR